MVAWFIVVRRDGYNDIQKVTLKEALPITIKALPAVMLPIIIIVGIRMGYFTPTEGGAVACVYAFVVATVLNRKLKLSAMPDILFNAMKSTAVVMFIVGPACAVAWIISMADVPAELTEQMTAFIEHPILLLIMINILLLALGMVMDIVPIILIFSPVLFPLITDASIYSILLCSYHGSQPVYRSADTSCRYSALCWYDHIQSQDGTNHKRHFTIYHC